MKENIQATYKENEMKYDTFLESFAKAQMKKRVVEKQNL